MKALILALALGCASPLHALTVFPECTEMDETIEAAMARALDASQTYVMAVGSFRGAEVLTEQRGYDSDTLRRVTTRFTGQSATDRGFVAPLNAAVELEQACLNNACTPRTDGTPYLVFLLKDDQGFMVQLGEFGCTAPFFERPDAAMKQKAIQCLKNGGC